MNNAKHQYDYLQGSLNIAGKNIRFYRNQKRISAQKLSDKLMLIGLDIHRQAIYSIEAGKRSISDYELCAIAEILGVTSDILLQDYMHYLKSELN